MARRHDLSIAQATMTADGIKVTVRAPGVKASDIEVNALEHSLHVTGATHINGDVFCVDQRVMLPSGIDLDSAEATHESGELIVTLTRKAGKKIAVVNATPMTSKDKEAAASAAEESSSKEPAAETEADMSEGEWVGKEDECSES